KWGKSYNRCRAGIYCIGVNALEIKGVATSMQASISINKTGGNNAVTIHGEKFYLKLCCSCINFVGPPVYTSL
ncbi:MAG: immunity 50 family protein, partial [Azoarcus sp.]|nr:immunity 50 family protein [Azoarcus sp.]